MKSEVEKILIWDFQSQKGVDDNHERTVLPMVVFLGFHMSPHKLDGHPNPCTICEMNNICAYWALIIPFNCPFDSYELLLGPKDRTFFAYRRA